MRNEKNWYKNKILRKEKNWFNYLSLSTPQKQVFHRLINQPLNCEFVFYALPFTPRKKRETLFNHRPEQSEAPEVIAEKHKIKYILKKTLILITPVISTCWRGGILSPECVKNKKIINAHPGFQQSEDYMHSSGQFMKPLGITLHFINEEVDMGEIIAVVPTPVYKTDSFGKETL